MKALYFLPLIAVVSSSAFAQAAIAGSARAQSGVPLAGVMVQLASPALIEKVRLAVTDGGGLYRIENLRPGTYAISFSLPGWRPYRREGIELSGSSTVVVDAELTVGTLSEAITVTAAVPVVDAHSLSRELALSGNVVRSIPSARSYNALLVLVPGVATNSNDIVTGTATTSFPVHGGRTNEGRLTLEGLTIGSPPSGNSATSYVVDVGTSEEVTFRTATGLGETETAGLVMNIVLRSGGNAMRGSVFASGSGDALQSDNLTPALRDQGLTAATPLTGLYDVSGALGGPIAKDRLWYFANAHVGGSTKASANVFYNLNAGDPSKWLYAPDRDRPEYSDRTFENASARLTWQITPRHKVNGFWDAQQLCRSCTGATPGLAEPQRVSPEAVGVLGRPLNVAQAAWFSPLTNRLLVDAGFGATFFGVGNFEREPNPTRGLIRVAEQCASGCAANGDIPGLVYRSQDFSVADTGSYLWKGTLTYVTGAHSLKVGYQHTFMTDDRTWMTNDQNLTYRFNNGVPNQLTQSISPWVNDARVAWQGLFIQDQWTRNRLTLQGAARFDRAWSWFPRQQEGPSRFLPAPIVIPETRGVDSYKDVTVRMGVAYDLAGTGRTALKVTLGKYLEGAGVSGTYANTNPTLRMPQTTSVFGTAGVTRAWTDANRNFEPDCDLMNAAAQDLRASGGDLCGVLSNTSFGSERADQQRRSWIARRLGDPAVRLAPGHLPRAADRLAFVGRRHLHTSLVRRVFPRRQPRAAVVRPDPVQHRGASRSEIARWRRVRGRGTVRRRAGEVGRSRQPRRRFGRLRELVSVLQRARRHGQGPFAEGPDRGGGNQHRSDRRRQLRCAGTSPGACHHHDRHERSRSRPGQFPGHAGKSRIATSAMGSSHSCAASRRTSSRRSASSCRRRSRANQGRCWPPTTRFRPQPWCRRSEDLSPAMPPTSQ